MKTKLLILCLLVSTTIQAQNLLGYSSKQITKYYPKKTIHNHLLDNGTLMMYLSPKDSLHTNYYFIGKESKLCYSYVITAPKDDYEIAKDNFTNQTKFTYQGLTDEGYPYWIENISDIPVYWVLKSQQINTKIYTVVMCGLKHP